MAVETLLLTGATGFVGSHVVEAAKGQPVRLRALVRKESDADRLGKQGVTCIRGSLDDPHALRAAASGADAVLHLAAATRARTLDEYQRANAAGTQAVVEAIMGMSPNPPRLVYLSSLAAVGPSYDGRPVTRDTVPRPMTAYGRTKLAGEKICQANSDRVDVAILRAPAVYGPRDRDVFQFFRMARRGAILLPGGPDRRLQMIHAADLARALLLAATGEGVGGVYHVAEARSYELGEMARMVGTAVRRRATILRLPAGLITAAAAISETGAGLLGKSTIFNRDKAVELLAPAWLCETELARRDFGFDAHIALQTGLTETANWYFQHGWL